MFVDVDDKRISSLIYCMCHVHERVFARCISPHAACLRDMCIRVPLRLPVIEYPPLTFHVQDITRMGTAGPGSPGSGHADPSPA